jgi:hypothetical protein
MKGSELLTEGLAHDRAEQIIEKFVDFCQEHLGIDELPEINLITGADRSVENKSFGGYGNRNINVSISNRHIMDVCRTLAHELVHFKQDIGGELEGDNPGATGSPQENEANAQAAVIMRNWGKRYPRLFAQPAIE